MLARLPFSKERLSSPRKWVRTQTKADAAGGMRGRGGWHCYREEDTSQMSLCEEKNSGTKKRSQKHKNRKLINKQTDSSQHNLLQTLKTACIQVFWLCFLKQLDLLKGLPYLMPRIINSIYGIYSELLFCGLFQTEN